MRKKTISVPKRKQTQSTLGLSQQVHDSAVGSPWSLFAEDPSGRKFCFKQGDGLFLWFPVQLRCVPCTPWGSALECGPSDQMPALGNVGTFLRNFDGDTERESLVVYNSRSCAVAS